MLPSILVLIALTEYPFFYALYISAFTWQIGSEPVFVGLGNYLEVLLDSGFWYSVNITAIFTTVAVVCEFFLGLGLALVLNRKIRGSGVFRALISVPMILTPVVIALVWRVMFNPALGILNYLLELVGLSPSGWAFHPKTALLSVALVDIWQWTPFVMICMAAGLEALPREPFEAAQLDGASRWQVFRHVTFPLLTPITIVVLIFRIMDAFKTFDIIFGITAGGPGNATETWVVSLFRNAFFFHNWGYSSASAIIMFLVTLVYCEIIVKVLRRT